MDEIKVITKYLFQGKEFSSREEVNEYLKEFSKKYTQVYNTHYTEYNNGTKSFYEIFDEGPIDFASTGSPRKLDTVFGTYDEVVKYAVFLDGFWGYGPGKIKLLKIKTL